MRLAGERQHFPDIQQDLLVRIVVAYLYQRLGLGHLDAQLLLQLTGQRRFHAFTVLDLAARKFPQTALMLVEWAFGDQYARFRPADDGRSNMDTLHFITSCTARSRQR